MFRSLLNMAASGTQLLPAADRRARVRWETQVGNSLKSYYRYAFYGQKAHLSILQASPSADDFSNTQI